MKLTLATMTYEIGIEDLQKHFAEQFKVEPFQVSVEAKAREQCDAHDRYSRTVFVGLKVIVQGAVS